MMERCAQPEIIYDSTAEVRCHQDSILKASILVRCRIRKFYFISISEALGISSLRSPSFANFHRFFTVLSSSASCDLNLVFILINIIKRL